MTNGALPLATSIAAMERGELAALVRARLRRAGEGVQDPLTLALELLRGDSVARALSIRDVSELAALVRLDEASEDGPERTPADDPGIRALIGLGLAGADESGAPVALPEVAAALDAALAAAGLSREHLRAASPAPAGPAAADPAASPAAADHAAAEAPAAPWYGAALTTVARAAAILRSLAQKPGKVNRRGTIAVTFVRGLAEQFGIDPDVVQRCLRTLECAGLVSTARLSAAPISAASISAVPTSTMPVAAAPTDSSSGSGSLVPSAAGADWLALPHPERWAVLAEARIAGLDEQFRRCLALEPDDARAAATELLASRYPLLPEQARLAAAEAAETLEDLGLAVDRSLTAPARAALPLALDRPAARERLAASAAEHMPEAVDSVYLQPDLSVIVPGPLRPDDERIITSVSEAEQLGVASTLRITPEALARTVDAGTAPEDLRILLDRLSVTGVPQPLSFLIDELERRDRIVVAPHTGDEGRTVVETSRAETAEMLRVDRSLQHLQLQPEAGSGATASSAAPSPSISASSESSAEGPFRLFSRLGAEHVLTALLDARYPAARRPEADPAGTVPAVGREDAPDADPSADADDQDELEALVDRVFASARSEPGEADVARRLDLAIRDRSRVRLTAEARGREYEFLVLPVSLSGGRLRATDEAAGVERTLPLSAIVSVAPA